MFVTIGIHVATRRRPIVKQDHALRRRLEALFELRYSEANMGWPTLTPGNVFQFGQWARNSWPSPASVGDPRAWLVRAHFILCPVAQVSDSCKEITDGTRLVYPPGGNPREQGMLIWHAGAEGLAKRDKKGWAQTHADIWLITAEMACSQELQDLWGIERLVRRQKHVDPWFARGYHGWCRRYRHWLAAELYPRRTAAFGSSASAVHKVFANGS